MNFDKPQEPKRERGDKEIEIIQSDPDSLRVYASYSDKYLTVDIQFPDIKSHDAFFSSDQTYEDFLKAGGKFTLSGETNPSELSIKPKNNSSALDTEETFSYDEYGITSREFSILHNTVIDHFFRKD